MPIGYNGKSYPLVAQDKMMASEIDAVERATGLTLQKIRRMGETCVCEHGSAAHMHKNAAGEQDPDNTSCDLCSCQEHEADVPMRVTTAFAWVSVKRGEPTLKFSDFADSPMSEWNVEDEAEADPTVPPPKVE